MLSFIDSGDKPSLRAISSDITTIEEPVSTASEAVTRPFSTASTTPNPFFENFILFIPRARCAERTCADCGGCDSPLRDRPAGRKDIVSYPYQPRWIGLPGDELVRYRAVYEKTGKARYLSHIDLIQVLERAFRRACVAVRQTQGYHPKPDFSYGPALPLGMEGSGEVLEFKSRYLLERKEFLTSINRALPIGFRFLDLKRLALSDPSLSRSMKVLVYSMGWEETSSPGSGTVEERLAAYRREHEDISFEYRVEGRRLVLEIPLSSQKIPRIQDIVSEVFGLEHPAFHLRRDEIVLN